MPRPECTSECLLCPLQVLFNQFKYFFNLYFLLLACSQFVPEMRLGALYTYWVPLVSQLGRPFGRIRGRAAGTERGLSGRGRPQANTLGAPEVFLLTLCSAHRHGAWVPPSFRLSVVESLLVSQAFPCSPRIASYSAPAHSGPEKGRASGVASAL